MSDRVSVTIEGAVADVRLNRPDKLNALDRAMFEALRSVGETLSEDRSLRCVVLSGEGRAFCAGLDFASFMAMSESDKPSGGLLEPVDDGPATFAQSAAYVWMSLPVPVIAAVHGFAYGGGLQIALGADLRLVTPDVKLSVMEIKWGLIPDMTGTQTLRHLVRLDVAKELTFTGRIVGGEEAVQLGLATRLSEAPYDDAMALAREIAGKSPHAIRAAKQVFGAAGYVDLASGLKNEAQLQRTLIGSPNQIETVQANLAKRAPNFVDCD